MKNSLNSFVGYCLSLMDGRGWDSFLNNNLLAILKTSLVFHLFSASRFE